MFRKDPTIYIGYDKREDLAFRVCAHSIRKNARKNINIVPLDESALRRAGLYRRAFYFDGPNQKIDQTDGKPFSTDFSFTRFLIPHLHQYDGLALFMDCDMYLRTDIWELFATIDMSKAVSCVKHNYKPKDVYKMDLQKQTQYERKNWSSFVVWNCSHDANKRFTVDDVNVRTGSWLHRFSWLENEEIGSLDEAWNWLDGHSPEEINPKNVHFTTGGPQFHTWSPSRLFEDKYVAEWNVYNNELTNKEALVYVE